MEPHPYATYPPEKFPGFPTCGHGGSLKKLVSAILSCFFKQQK